MPSTRPESAQPLPVRALDVRWGGRTFRGAGVLQLEEDGVRAGALASTVHVPYGEIAGASWRAGRLVLHGEADDAITAEDGDGLERAWTSVTARACPVPEFTRGLRRLGSPRGGHAAAQDRFLAPLLQARRRLEEEVELDQRVAAFDAGALAVRLAQSLTAIAAGLYPESPPEQRALEAQLQECGHPLHGALSAAEDAARTFREARDATRFIAWRRWVDAVHDVFAEADRVWGAALQVLPAAPSTKRRWWRPRWWRRRWWRRRWWRRRGMDALLALLAAGFPPSGLP